MKTDTQDKILTLIKQNSGITAKNIVGALGLNATGIFRHLQKLQVQGKIYKIGKVPSVQYYLSTTKILNNSTFMQTAFNWASADNPPIVSEENLCPTRDVFQTRLDHQLINFKRELKNDNLAYLLLAMTGEIGNNSFDHNLGNWRDIMGVLFLIDWDKRELILADRGQGVMATIKHVRPEITTDAEALQIAFTEIISGRAPEQRGNGLKFVKKIMEENNLHLQFYSGNAVCEIEKNKMQIKPSDINIFGTLAIITFYYAY